MTDITLDIITSTNLIEYGDYMYAAMVDGSYFVLVHSPKENSMCLSMSFLEASIETREALVRKMLSSLKLREDQITLSDHSVSIQKVVREGWLYALKVAIQIISSWAKENHLESGCFLCGRNDHTVLFQQEHEQNMYVCDSCKVSLQQGVSQNQQAVKMADLADTKRENLAFGLLVSFVTRFILSIIWIPIAITTLKASIKSNYFNDTFAFTLLFSVVSMFLMIKLYKKATGNISTVAYVAVCIIHIVLSFIDTLWIMSMALRNTPGSLGMVFASDPLGWISNLNFYLYGILPSITSFFYSAPFIGIILYSLIFFICKMISAVSKDFITQNS